MIHRFRRKSERTATQFIICEKHRRHAKFETGNTTWPKNLLRNQLTRQASLKDPQIGFHVGGEFAHKIDKIFHLPSFEAVNFVSTLPWSAGSSWLEKTIKRAHEWKQKNVAQWAQTCPIDIRA